MNNVTTAGPGLPAASRRSDAGTVRLTGRDIAGLVLCGDMNGAPYDLLAGYLGVREDRLRAIVSRWRRAGRPAWRTCARSPATVAAIIRDHQQLTAQQDGSQLSPAPITRPIRTTQKMREAGLPGVGLVGRDGLWDRVARLI